MRFYLKLFVFIAMFACASRWPLRQTISDLRYDARVACVLARGSASDYEALIDHTRYMMAQERGSLDLYLKGKRFEQLLAQRLAAAARLNLSLSEDDLIRIREQCVIEAFGSVEDLSAPDCEKVLTVSAAHEGDDSARHRPGAWVCAPRPAEIL